MIARISENREVSVSRSWMGIEKSITAVMLSMTCFIPATATAWERQALLVPYSANAVVVHQYRRGHEHVDLAAGSMTYSDEPDNEGYLPERVIPVVAQRRSRVLDYPLGFTAFQVGDSAEIMLRRLGYRIEYRCSRETCGDSAGWGLFMGDGLAGSESTQHYLLASREILPGRSEYAQYYVADLHGRPRLLLNTFVGESLAEKSIQPGQPITMMFLPDSAELTLHTREILREWVKSNRLTSVRAVEVIGYVDPHVLTGGGHALERLRVEAVADWLKAEAAMSGIRVTTSVSARDARAGTQVPGQGYVALRILEDKSPPTDKPAETNKK